MPQSIRATTAARAAVFAPIAGGGRAELVTQRLSDAIDLGLLNSGEKLPSEAEMARQFGVATVTAREALEALRERGLVETRRGRDGGSFVIAIDSRATRIARRVASLSRVELRDMGVHYAAIAGAAAELAADRSTDDDIRRLRETVEAVDSGDETSTRRGEGTFRLEVAALSQSARLVREELRLQAEFAPLLWWCLRDSAERRTSRAEHLAVVAAIETLDGAEARRRTVEHIGGAIEWLLDEKTALEAGG
ncbi:GntR family transcriptional regulator [Pseudolysinimonas sp.]|uniref:FadR/GntR family transcriptional regulator n=1 Tax=Pseudolysinimonas sp. TaxID=2680009 RepID=UPI00286A9A8B|nr:GntR family transcriptional regulator [Pseudolysinimonas sp.]